MKIVLFCIYIKFWLFFFNFNEFIFGDYSNIGYFSYGNFKDGYEDFLLFLVKVLSIVL